MSLYLRFIALVLLMFSTAAFGKGRLPELFTFQKISDGKKESQTSFKGQPMILQVWAPWCHSCGKIVWDLDLVLKDFKKVRYDLSFNGSAVAFGQAKQIPLNPC